MYDVAIVGAGPAGATLARLLAGQQRVLLLDRRRLTSDPCPDFPTKCCGGLLAPDAQKLFAALGLTLPEHVLCGPQLFAVRAIDVQARQDRLYQRHYINIDRERFDRYLVSLVDRSVDLRCGCVVRRYEQAAGGVRIHFTQDGKPCSQAARVLVGADGANSIVRRQLLTGAGQAHSIHSYLAIQEWVQAAGTAPHFAAVFDREVTDFYGWVIPKGRHLLLGCAIPKSPGAAAKFELFKRRLNGFGFRWGAAVRREGSLLLRPGGRSSACAGAGNVLLIGEAGGWISPSSAEGLSYAFATAICAAKVLARPAPLPAAAYGRAASPLRLRLLLKTLKCPIMYNPLLRRLAMGSGVGAIEPAILPIRTASPEVACPGRQ